MEGRFKKTNFKGEHLERDKRVKYFHIQSSTGLICKYRSKYNYFFETMRKETEEDFLSTRTTVTSKKGKNITLRW
jgi:hypothetical protein